MSDFKLKRPCGKCPFRTDVPGYLRRERAAQIARDLVGGASFACHETTEVVEDEDGYEDRVATEGSQHCAGALILMEHEEAPNQDMRIAERLGLYDASKLDMAAPVHRSFIAFVNHHGEDEEEEDDCCSVVNGDCEAPAGLLVNGSVVPAERTGEVHSCPQCGESVCGACSVPDGRCDYCAEW